VYYDDNIENRVLRVALQKVDLQTKSVAHYYTFNSTQLLDPLPVRSTSTPTLCAL